MDIPSAVFWVAVRQFHRLPLPTTDCTGKTVIVTGGNVGLGLETARHFVRLNAARVIIACRNLEKGETAKADIESTTGRTGVVEVWSVDLASFDSVKEFCARAAELDRLDIVIENAGVAPAKPQLAEGYESQITVNVISTALMALKLLTILRQTSTKYNVEPHLVIVSSDAHRFVTWPVMRQSDNFFEALRTDKMFHERYNISKLLEVLFVRELAQAMDRTGKPKVVVNTAHPGLCSSQLFRDLPAPFSWILAGIMLVFARTCEYGARNFVYAGLLPETHGTYISECKPMEVSPRITNELGDKTQKQVYKELLDVLERIEPGVTGNI
ncbi:putative short-chain dehydrogenase/reductase family protein [Microdochium trichocladiopsis]|uniref:Short-chain dehydrogenase/reductase family protein n=1 Tax=Microdochium trichocladiopsis TaxID=1682393 RepID=A0A9P9BRN7_9PEZI|nr:putative short-chain dehydrogenase/reductase family protein [Microdochium trichocladiopsis]KAH7033010.1 putative short-chain dehydrogenase/reductase family protein [Microdochium trichocladiopsis]